MSASQRGPGPDAEGYVRSFIAGHSFQVGDCFMSVLLREQEAREFKSRLSLPGILGRRLSQPAHLRVQFRSSRRKLLEPLG